MIFIGVDPGASGGVGIIRTHHTDAVPAECHKMPETPRDIVNLLDDQLLGYHRAFVYAVLERVNAMPKQGVSSTFKFGRSYGLLEGALAALEIPYELVAPTVWQKAMGCLSKGDKNVTKARAQQMFPGLKVTHATADALLLADFARRTWVNRYGEKSA
jgi:Holliday junction resolvasome RuvABC endonuclease subunit